MFFFSDGDISNYDESMLPYEEDNLRNLIIVYYEL